MKFSKIPFIRIAYFMRKSNIFHKVSCPIDPCFSTFRRKQKARPTAVSYTHLSDNPTLNLLIPKPQIKTEKKLKLYTKEQLELFLNEVSQEQNPYFKNRDYTLFRLLAFSGCRIGEILALTWDNINFKTNEMAIKKTVARSDKYYISETPKTKKSNRIIYLDEKTIKQLKFWKIEQRKYLFQLGFTKAN